MKYDGVSFRFSISWGINFGCPTQFECQVQLQNKSVKVTLEVHFQGERAVVFNFLCLWNAE